MDSSTVHTRGARLCYGDPAAREALAAGSSSKPVVGYQSDRHPSSSRDKPRTGTPSGVDLRDPFWANAVPGPNVGRAWSKYGATDQSLRKTYDTMFAKFSQTASDVTHLKNRLDDLTIQAKVEETRSQALAHNVTFSSSANANNNRSRSAGKVMTNFSANQSSTLRGTLLT